MVGLVTLQPHRMHPSSTLSSSFLLKNANTYYSKLVSIKIQCLTLAITGCLLVYSFICWALTGPLSVVSVKFTMSPGMGVFFWCINQWHPSKAICIAIFLVLDLCLRVKLYICLKHYGPPEDTGRGSFREGFVLTKQTQ